MMIFPLWDKLSGGQILNKPQTENMPEKIYAI